MRVRDSKTGRFAPEWKAKRWPKRFKREIEPKELPKETEEFLDELEAEEEFLEEVGEDWEIDGDFTITEDEPYDEK